MDAQVEVKPHKEPSVGGGTRMHRGNKKCEMESKFESLFMEWITKHDVQEWETTQNVFKCAVHNG